MKDTFELYNKWRYYYTPMEVIEWMPNTDELCQLCPAPVREPTPAEGATDAASQHGIISWLESN